MLVLIQLQLLSYFVAGLFFVPELGSRPTQLSPLLECSENSVRGHAVLCERLHDGEHSITGFRYEEYRMARPGRDARIPKILRRSFSDAKHALQSVDVKHEKVK